MAAEGRGHPVQFLSPLLGLDHPKSVWALLHLLYFWHCQLKSNWADFQPRDDNMKAEKSMSYEFVYGLIFGHINLTW